MKDLLVNVRTHDEGETLMTAGDYTTDYSLNDSEIRLATVCTVARGQPGVGGGGLSLDDADKQFEIVTVGLSEDTEATARHNAMEAAYDSLKVGKPIFIHVNYKIDPKIEKSGNHWSSVALTKDINGKVTITDLNSATKDHPKYGALRNDTVGQFVGQLTSYVTTQEQRAGREDNVVYQDCSVDRQCDNCCGLSVALSDAEVVAHLASNKPIEALKESQRTFSSDEEMQAGYSAMARGVFSIAESTTLETNKQIFVQETKALKEAGIINKEDIKKIGDGMKVHGNTPPGPVVDAVLSQKEREKMFAMAIGQDIQDTIGKESAKTFEDELRKKHTQNGKLDLTGVKQDLAQIKSTYDLLREEGGPAKEHLHNAIQMVMGEEKPQAKKLAEAQHDDENLARAIAESLTEPHPAQHSKQNTEESELSQKAMAGLIVEDLLESHNLSQEDRKAISGIIVKDLMEELSNGHNRAEDMPRILTNVLKQHGLGSEAEQGAKKRSQELKLGDAVTQLSHMLKKQPIAAVRETQRRPAAQFPSPITPPRRNNGASNEMGRPYN